MRAAVFVVAMSALACDVNMGGRIGSPPEYPPPATSGEPAAPAPLPSAVPPEDAGIVPSAGDVPI
jgi:hypothetical protein